MGKRKRSAARASSKHQNGDITNPDSIPGTSVGMRLRERRRAVKLDEGMETPHAKKKKEWLQSFQNGEEGYVLRRSSRKRREPGEDEKAHSSGMGSKTLVLKGKNYTKTRRKSGNVPDNIEELSKSGEQTPMCSREMRLKARILRKRKKEEEEEEDFTLCPEAALPENVELITTGEYPKSVMVPTSIMADLLSAYSILRSFSWQLRLSPFSFADFAAAIRSCTSTALMDEIHICIVRALAVDEVPFERGERILDLEFLDAVTWPSFIWETLRLYRDTLAAQEWKQRRSVFEDIKQQECDRPDNNCNAQMTIKDNSVEDNQHVSSDNFRQTSGREKPEYAFQPINEAVMDSASIKQAASSIDKLFETDFALAPQRCREYCALTTAIKAKIIARLCDYLLDCTTIRAEIDRREQNDEFVTGKGGEGSVFAMMTLEEKRLADAHAAEMHGSDANTDLCLLCAQGGSLICCDNCPAAYHMRCLGETGKTIGDGNWACPECSVGGRGEMAGLRIPAGARNQWNQLYYLMNGILVRVALPVKEGRGRRSQEVNESSVMTIYSGETAKNLLECSKSLNSSPEDAPKPSSYEIFNENIRNKDSTPCFSGGPEGYINRYRNSWGAALSIIEKVVEDCKKQKYKELNFIPTGTCGRVVVDTLPVPTPISRYTWPQIIGKPPTQTITRCGKCRMCLRPSLGKDCLSPILGYQGSQETSIASNSSSHAFKLSCLVAYIVKVEKEFWSLAEGPWAGVGGDSQMFRSRWSSRLRSFKSLTDIVNSLLTLENSLRYIAFKSDWHGLGEDQSMFDSKIESSTGIHGSYKKNKSGHGSLSSTRAGTPCKRDDVSLNLGVDAYFSSKKNSKFRRQRPHVFLADSEVDTDPYTTRYEKMVKSGWEINQRHKSHRISGLNRLPLQLIQKAARQAGRQPIPGILWYRGHWSVTAPRIQWISEVQAANTISDLAIALRKFDTELDWDVSMKPREEDVKYSIRAKRGLSGSMGYEYLLEMQETRSEATEMSSKENNSEFIDEYQRQNEKLLIRHEILVGKVLQESIENGGLMKTFEVEHSKCGKIQQQHKLDRETIRLIINSIIDQAIANQETEVDEVENLKERRRRSRRATEMPLSLRDSNIELLKFNVHGSTEHEYVKSDDEVSNSDDSNGVDSCDDESGNVDMASISPLVQDLVISGEKLGMKYLWKHEKDIPLYLIRQYEEEFRKQANEMSSRSRQDLQELMKTKYFGMQTTNKLPTYPNMTYEEFCRDSNNCKICGALASADEPLNDEWTCCVACKRWFHNSCFDIAKECIDKDWTCLGCTAWKERVLRREGPEAMCSLLARSPEGNEQTRIGRPPKQFFEKVEYKALEWRIFLETIWNRKYMMQNHDGFDGQNSQSLRDLNHERLVFNDLVGEIVKPTWSNENFDEKNVFQMDLASACDVALGWKEKALKVLRQTNALSIAADFRQPVTVDIAPNYFDIISDPMDLDTLERKLTSYLFKSPLEVINNFKLIVENCIKFNGIDSEYTQDAIEMERLFLKYWTQENLPTTEEEWMFATYASDRYEIEQKSPKLFGTAKSFPTIPSPEVYKPFRAAFQALSPSAGAYPARSWDVHAKSALSTVVKMPESSHFLEPVPLDFLNYHDIIKQPMDLGTIVYRLYKEKYKHPSELAKDMALVWSNCRIFNEAEAPVVQDSAICEAKFVEKWFQNGVYINNVPSAAALAAMKGGSWHEDPKRGPTWRAAASKVMYRMHNFVNSAVWFVRPVSEVEAPGYGQIISKPMDLGTISSKLQQGKYRSPNEILEDVELIWDNARRYNGPSHEVTKAAELSALAFAKIWTSAGLHGLEEEASKTNSFHHEVEDVEKVPSKTQDFASNKQPMSESKSECSTEKKSVKATEKNYEVQINIPNGSSAFVPVVQKESIKDPPSPLTWNAEYSNHK